MSEANYKTHPGNPSNQGFNVGARPNKTKRHSWWNANSSTFWRNRDKKKTEGRRDKKDRA